MKTDFKLWLSPIYWRFLWWRYDLCADVFGDIPALFVHQNKAVEVLTGKPSTTAFLERGK